MHDTQVLARLDKDLLITICLQAEEQRRIALAEQMAASNAAAKATSEVAQLRQTVANLQQAIISLPQQSVQTQQHMQHQHVQQPAASSMYNSTMGGGDMAGMNHNGTMNMGMSSSENDPSGSGNGNGNLGMGLRHVSMPNGVHGDRVEGAGATAPAAAGAIGASIGAYRAPGYSHQPMAQSGYRQW